MCDPVGSTVVTAQHSLELNGAALLDAGIARYTCEPLDEKFSFLGTRFAGGNMRELVNCRPTVIGDTSRHLEDGAAPRALVREPGAARHARFLPDVESFDARLRVTGAKTRGLHA
ncbi:DUF4180 domain-containing protein [Streptomyces sp. NPDC005794]|uniref:DUF4180 domain-containing protein n=1 Tax=Streptomyces sp. NPDC005794 TaxID=3364733 RepID=UPI0036802DDD